LGQRLTVALAEVLLWGKRIGAVAMEPGAAAATFQYERAFASSGIEVSPLVMPLATSPYTFLALPAHTFHGLPGLLADALPDKFGQALIDTWLARQGRTPGSFNAVERLCYVGTRGMGALEFHPIAGPRARRPKRIEVAELVRLASEVLSARAEARGRLDALEDILLVGTSAGGARAKAIIAWNPATNEVRSGHVPAPEGFSHWLLKLDGVSGNKDKEREDPKGYGAIEFAYSKMARDAGITMTACRLHEEGPRRHFMTRRFDRTDNGEKVHVQSLGALAHFDYNSAGAYSYEQAFDVMRRLGLTHPEIEQQFRRMVFNIVGRNQDDHVKNIAFLMDKTGRWTLSPAYDVSYSYEPKGAWTASHQMRVNGKRDDFTLDDLRAVGAIASLKRGQAEVVHDEVRAVVARWQDYAAAEGVPAVQRDTVQANLRLDLPRA
jgi:serine/threonine-protein kinase HipA